MAHMCLEYLRQEDFPWEIISHPGLSRIKAFSETNPLFECWSKKCNAGRFSLGMLKAKLDRHHDDSWHKIIASPEWSLLLLIFRHWDSVKCSGDALFLNIVTFRGCKSLETCEIYLLMAEDDKKFSEWNFKCLYVMLGMFHIVLWIISAMTIS